MSTNHTTTHEWLHAEAFADVAAAAVQAPSMHNSQPWHFRQRGQAIEVLADLSRQLPVADPTGWAVRLSCGAALLNLRLALSMRGTVPHVRLMPDPQRLDVLARLTPGQSRPATPEERRLYQAIPRRHTNRFPFTETPVPAAVRARLIAAAQVEAGWLDLLNGPAALSAVAELVAAADRALTGDASYRAETASWARTADAPDGVPVAAGGPAPLAFELLARRHFGDSDRHPIRDYEREPLVGVLGVAGDTQADQLQAGQALQRVLLTATDLGLATSMLSQPIEVPSVRERLRLAVGRPGAPQMLLRFGYGVGGPTTGRRPVADVITTE